MDYDCGGNIDVKRNVMRSRSSMYILDSWLRAVNLQQSIKDLIANIPCNRGSIIIISSVYLLVLPNQLTALHVYRELCLMSTECPHIPVEEFIWMLRYYTWIFNDTFKSAMLSSNEKCKKKKCQYLREIWDWNGGYENTLQWLPVEIVDEIIKLL